MEESDLRRPVAFREVGEKAFRSILPIVASLAAGTPFHGFETRDLTWVEEVDWIEVPAGLAKHERFVVQVVGDSMEPGLRIGDWVVFEWHRNPRQSGQIVIANLPEFGSGIEGTQAIKRFREEPHEWVFESDNPAYEPIRVKKEEIGYPILGTMVERLGPIALP